MFRARRHPTSSLLTLLRSNADFRRLFCASAFSLTGDWLTFVALSGFVYQRTGSPGWIALLFSVNSLPGVVLMPLIGPLTDRVDRRRLRIACTWCLSGRSPDCWSPSTPGPCR